MSYGTNQQRGASGYSARGSNPGPPEMRNGSYGSVTAGKPADSISNQDRAARFEDEKKRIIESCFAKRDPDGTQLESYITHVRVTEDAMYPSSPAPANSPPANKKNRIILVAVRRSGKVRVHKARENPNGSFSIGKTWNLDELSAIQSYTGFAPGSNQENMERQWAGSTGFLVTLGKPYYWQASTSKEKDFFIASLVKIFRKYTGGRIPQLTGFAPQEMDLLTNSTPATTPAMGGTSPHPTPSPGLPTPVPTPPTIPAAMASPRPQSPLAPRTPSRVSNQAEPVQNRGYNRPAYRPETREGQRIPSEDPPRSPARLPLQPASNEDLRKRSFGERPSYQDPFAKSSVIPAEMPPPLRPSASPRPSISSLQQNETRAELPGSKPNGAPMISAATTLPFAPKKYSLGSRSQESVTAVSDRSSPSRPSTSTEKTIAEPVPPVPPIDDGMPDRLRPHVGNNREASKSEKSLHSPSASQFVTPAASPGVTRVEKVDEPAPLKLSKNNLSQTNITAEPTEYFEPKPPSVRKDSQASVHKPTDASTGPVTAERPATPANATVTSPDGVPASEGELSPKKEEEYRPGLGPMIKKKSTKDIANQFRKAALAASAFQPRQGGAGARLKALQDKNNNEPDGITGVVPAPLVRGMSTDSVASQTPSITSPGAEKERPRTPLVNVFSPKIQLQRSATDDSVKAPAGPAKPVDEPQTDVKVEDKAEPTEPARTGSPQRKKRQRQEAEVEKFCTVLGIDPRIMEGRGADFNEILTEFGWEGRLPEKQKIEHFETSIRRENGRAQATGWLGHVEQQDVRVQELSKAFDKAIAECEEMDGLLTLYSHELDTLAEDIEYIEAQSQGLQVQTANQKLLQAELQSLLQTLTISSSDLRALQAAPLDSGEGVQAIEKSLVTLYRALLTIDPEMRQNKTRQVATNSNDRTGVGVYADQEIGQMRAVMQKKEEYREESLQFLRRFNQHMTAMFKQAEQRTSEENTRSLASTSSSSLSLPTLQTSRMELWLYNPMMLFVREVNNYEWSTLISSYEINIKNAYVDNFREYMGNQRKNARKPAGEELEALFTHQEKEKGDESMTTTAARKLTVKRGKAVKAGGLRQTFDRRDGKPDAWEIFDTVLQEQAKMVAEEQNFIVHLFHLNSQANVDFMDAAGRKILPQRTLPNLSTQLPYDSDRDMAKQVQNTVEGIYTFWTTDLQGLMEWVVKTDQLQAVGALCALERTLATYEETNQEFMTRTLRGLHDRLAGLFHKFLDDQVKAIEETKVKVSKRKGVIPFMRTFPVFSAVLESMIPQEFYHNESLELRFILNDAYTKLLKAMWESLTFIAKDNPASGSGTAQSGAPSGGDPEDKEALNYHILLIENMNHFLEEVETHSNVVLEEWRERAEQDMLKHLTNYTDAVIRRPLGKWLDFLESTEALMKTQQQQQQQQTSSSLTSISNKPSHSRSSAKKVLSSYDSKEIRKGIETLKKRIEKHFGDVDNPAVGVAAHANSGSKSLITRVLDECNARYAHAHDRMKTIVDQVYEGNLEIDWRKEEVAGLFKR